MLESKLTKINCLKKLYKIEKDYIIKKRNINFFGIIDISF